MSIIQRLKDWNEKNLERERARTEEERLLCRLDKAEDRTLVENFSTRGAGEMLKTASVIGIVIGITLIITSLAIEIPSRRFRFYEVEKYVGGDAYNASIEASIRAGEIAGASASKAIYRVGGSIILVFSLVSLAYSKDSVNAENDNELTALMLAAINNNSDVITALAKNGANVNAKDKDGWTA
jgi:hypothetical protein